MMQKSFIPVYILTLMFMLTSGNILGQQNDSIVMNQQKDSVAIDTSYFQAGRDDLNLLESVINGNVANTKLLLDRGADPNTVSTTKNSVLMYAIEAGNFDLIRMLVQKGADVNHSGYNGETPLFMAIFHNDFQSAKYLLEQGANPNIKDAFGVTPLMYAAATNQYQSADLLLFYYADPAITDGEGNDPLITAVTFENLETTDVLLQNGLDPDVKDNKGNTPLIIATQHGNYEIMDLLLDYEADVNLTNHRNYTALAYAITYADNKAVKLLVNSGADIHHSVDKGRNMTDLARIADNDSIIFLLDSKGGKPTSGTDFSEYNILFGNSFNSTDYFMQFRLGVSDSKHGYFFDGGIDYRPTLLKIQRTINDTIYQFRERRIGLSHTAGKYFKIVEFDHSLRLSLYGSLSGYLSFPRYQGSNQYPRVNYDLIPAAGIALTSKHAGIRFATEWYRFQNELEKGLKYNVSVFFRLSYPEVHYDRKEIFWE